MTAQPDDWQYWAIDLPGLTQVQAEELLGMAEKAGMSFGGTTVDPSQFLTFHIDRATVESLYNALSSIAEDEQGLALSGVREGLKEWLDLFPPDEL
jgi:hypothetical protein